MGRERSFWAWGWEDRFPSLERRRELASQTQLLFGERQLVPAELPVLERVELPAPRLEVPRSLAEFCTADRRERIDHTYGKAYRDIVRAFRGDFRAAPDLVAAPRDERDLEALLEWCGAQRVALIPFGGGTSVVGGVEAALPSGFNGAVSCDLRRLHRVLEVDPTSRAARIQAGAKGPDLDAQLAPHGLSLRHFPQSYEFSTLGGWIATRAGGHFATLYTHIDDLVESTRMLTAAGVMQTRRLPASGAGPSPDRLVLGSEGILGVITEAWVRVQARPIFRASASVHFDEHSAGVDAVRAIAQAGLYPANCRLLDAREAFMNQVAFDGSSVLVLAFESADHSLEPWLERALELARGHRGRVEAGPKYSADKASAEGAASSWRSAFLEAPYLQSALISLGVLADTFETACTWDRFAALDVAVRGAVEAVLQRRCGAGLVSCRFTHVYPDGPAPYYTFVAPVTPGEELDVWAEVKAAASDALIAHGATITHHHAVGRTHRPWYDRERPEPFAVALRAAKAALDPRGVLNPGVLLTP